jgi:hypothetical protein
MDNEIAGQEPVKKPEGVETTVVHAPEPDDYEAKLRAKDEEIAKISQEKENYKRAALKAKGKLPEEEEDLDEKMRRIAQETYLATQEAKALAEKDEMIRKMARDLSEAKLALKNRTQLTPTGGTAGPENEPEKKDNILSEAQLKELKAKFPHWTDKDIEAYKANLNK